MELKINKLYYETLFVREVGETSIEIKEAKDSKKYLPYLEYHSKLIIYLIFIGVGLPYELCNLIYNYHIIPSPIFRNHIKFKSFVYSISNKDCFECLLMGTTHKEEDWKIIIMFDLKDLVIKGNKLVLTNFRVFEEESYVCVTDNPKHLYDIEEELPMEVSELFKKGTIVFNKRMWDYDQIEFDKGYYFIGFLGTMKPAIDVVVGKIDDDISRIIQCFKILKLFFRKK